MPHCFLPPPARKTSFLALLAGLTLVSPSRAENDGNPQLEPSAFTETIDVRVINLEAVVVDRKGERVRNLGPEDFQLLVDGKEQEVRYFSEVVGGRVQASAESTPGAPGLETGTPVGTSYLVFLDLLFSDGRRIEEVLDGLISDLALLSPGDRMAIVAFDGNRLTELQGWTNSRPDLEKALRGSFAAKARSLQRRLALYDPSEGSTLSDEVSQNSAFLPIDLARRLERVYRAAATALRSYSDTPGRKVALLLAGEWPQSLHTYMEASRFYLGIDGTVNNFSGPALASAPGLYGPSMRALRAQNLIHQTANLLSYTLYPVDVPGRLESQQFDLVDASNPYPPGHLSVPAEVETHFSLRTMAAETGGRAMINAERLEAFSNVVNDTRSYYWLGFAPDWNGNDKEHKIELKVRRSDLEVRARESFYDLSRSEEVTRVAESAALIGNVPDTTALHVQIQQAQHQRKQMELSISIAIPMDEIVMLPREGGYRADLELRVAVLDDAGNRNEVRVVPVLLQGDRAPRPGEFARFDTTIKLRNDGHTLVIALHDPVSGSILLSKKEVRP